MDFPNNDATARFVGALLFEQNDGWAVQRSRYMTLGAIAPQPNSRKLTNSRLCAEGTAIAEATPFPATRSARSSDSTETIRLQVSSDVP
jgi:hypothetical protein